MMKKVSSIIFLFLMLTLGNSVFAQFDHYQYYREVPQMGKGWNKIILPNDIYSKLENDYQDIRIIGITPKGDTVEAPYILKREQKTAVSKSIEFNLINQSKDPEGYYYTFELSEIAPINEIQLNFKERNFDWKVDLEGSQDQVNWYSILENYRIVSIENAITDYSFSKLIFPISKYAYMRAKIKGPLVQPNLSASSILLKSEEKGRLTSVNIKKTTVSTIKESSQTKIDVYLGEALPVAFIKINALDKFDYYRHFNIECVTDSIETPAGWRVYSQPVKNGILSSLEDNAFHYEPVITHHLTLIVSNYDNPALNIGEIELGYFPVEVLIRVNEKADYFLFYGNEKARTPNYDINMFAENIPAEMAEVTPGKEIEIVFAPPTDKSLIKSKIWLWTAIILVMVLLSWLTLRMMKTKA